MLAAAFILALASTISARSIPRAPTYPPLFASNGVYLIANVTDPTMDLDPPVHGRRLSGVHTGAGLNRAAFYGDNGIVFYQNGTEEDVAQHDASMQFDMGTPPFPGGIMVRKDGTGTGDAKHAIDANAGMGTRGFVLSDAGKTGYAFLDPNFIYGEEGTFAVCREGLQYYQGQEFNTLNWIAGGAEAVAKFPACVPVTLLPECGTLPDLPEGSLSTHAFAREVSCYDNVVAVDWSA